MEVRTQSGSISKRAYQKHYEEDTQHADYELPSKTIVLNEKGIAYYENWDSHWNDKRSESYVMNKLMDRNFSVLPRFAEKVYGYGVKAEV